MTASTNIEIAGIKDAIRALNKIEPGLRKEFQQEATRIAQPAIEEAQREYVVRALPLSGMRYNWTQDGTKKFPYDAAKAARGVKVKLDAARNAVAVIVIQQTNVAAAIFEAAGRKTPNRLGQSLGPLSPGRTRIIGPAVYRKRGAITREMEQAALRIVNQVNRELK
jgi:hypothetical protein